MINRRGFYKNAFVTVLLQKLLGNTRLKEHPTAATITQLISQHKEKLQVTVQSISKAHLASEIRMSENIAKCHYFLKLSTILFFNQKN